VAVVLDFGSLILLVSIPHQILVLVQMQLQGKDYMYLVMQSLLVMYRLVELLLMKM
jgi:hypothetical protein